MKNRLSLILLSIALCAAAVSCDDILDRPDRNVPTDTSFWKSENDVRLYANTFYENYFSGYGYGWATNYAPFLAYGFSDVQTSSGAQSSFEDKVPSSRGTTSGYSASSSSYSYLTQYSGPTWNFTWVRSANIFIDRLESRMKGTLSEEAYNHWMAVAKFFKSFSYCRLVEVFGDVPYFEKEVGSSDLDELYKDRDNRVFVMDKIYDMCKNDILPNMRTDDGSNMLNRYVAAGFMSRWFLFEGTWQKYHGGDQAAAKKYLEFARDAAELVMNSGNYSISTPVRNLWGSTNLAGNKECLIYRHYDYASQKIGHCVGSYSNGAESQTGVNLAFLKSVICLDGKPYKKSSCVDASDPTCLSVPVMAKTRDPRFEACFLDTVSNHSSTMVYQTKFIDRKAIALGYEVIASYPEYASNTNENDCPVMRYGEVLINWIEAKAELAELGGAAVTQADIDRSINVLRHRPLDETATSKGLKITDAINMKLAEITADFDPDRDQTVAPLIWEIRRERELEMVFEHSRIQDLRRWKKLEYMDNDKYPDTMRGPWINFAKELPTYPKSGSTQVEDINGKVITYSGNLQGFEGYYIPTAIQKRDKFTDRVYCAPIGDQQISEYTQKGYTLTQTTGW